MASSDQLTNRRAAVVAAARAAASWGRARRATWTSVPLRLPPTITAAAAAAPSRSEPFIAPVAVEPAGPSVVARAAARARAIAAPVAQRLPRVAALTVLLVAGVWGGIVGARYVMQQVATSRARPKAPAPVAVRPQTPPRPVKTTGGLRVNSTPTGAMVSVDGKPRGVTPVTIDDLAVGRHTIEIRSASGTVQRTATVTANTISEIDESIFSGWVAVYAPFDLVISERGRTLALDERNQIMLPPGRHELRFTNRPLEYEAVRQIELKPGETLRLSITPDPSTLTVTANEPADVWLDGGRIGDAPINNAPITLGTHEIVVKRAAGGEKRFNVTVTAKPLTLAVTF